MEIAHLRVVLHTERVLLIPPYTQPHLVYGNDTVSRGPLKHMQLGHALFGGVHHLELREAHLEHHV